MEKKYEDFVKQINLVLEELKSRIKKEPERKILISLYERYAKAKEIVTNGDDLSHIMIKGSCRAYLDSFSDYMNPMLIDMDKAEELLEQIKKY